MKEIVIFELDNAKQPLDIWFNSLDKVIKKRILKRLDKLQEGYYGDFKIIDNEIKELRFKFGSGYRIYFHESKSIIILLLCGGDKSTQKNDILKAKEYLNKWKGNNNEFKI